jgi:uncharacterized protein YkwD
MVALLLSCGACYVPLPVQSRGPARNAPSPPTSMEVAAMARAVVQQANAVRTDVRAPPLRETSALTAAAQEYAVELATLRRLDHNSPTRGRRTVTDRLAAAGVLWQGAAENLAAMSDPMPEVPRVVVELWLNSAGHRRNLLNPRYTTTGVGIARDSRGRWYVVQLYVLPRSRR